jgi:DNA-binding IclR family transcriptional regulator
MTLEHHGLIDRDPLSQRYVIGYEVLRLAASAAPHELIASRARPIMDDLARDTGESISLVVLTPRGIVAIEQSDTRKIASVSVVGVHLPLHATASGKVRLAFASAEEREQLLSAPLERYTEQTLTSKKALLPVIAEVREVGYAMEHDEFEPGVSGVAAPVFGPSGNITAFISIWGLTSRLSPERLTELGARVRSAAEELTTRLSGGQAAA